MPPLSKHPSPALASVLTQAAGAPWLIHDPCSQFHHCLNSVRLFSKSSYSSKVFHLTNTKAGCKHLSKYFFRQWSVAQERGRMSSPGQSC